MTCVMGLSCVRFVNQDVRKLRSISSINSGKLGRSKLKPGAGIRWCLMSGGTCLWWGSVLARVGSLGWGCGSYQYSLQPALAQLAETRPLAEIEQMLAVI